MKTIFDVRKSKRHDSSCEVAPHMHSKVLLSHYKQSYVRPNINKYGTHNTYSYNHFHYAKTAVELQKGAQTRPSRHESVRGDRDKILDTHKPQ